MLGKFKPYPDFILPLLAHALVHGVATFLIAYMFKPKIAFLVALFDTTVHFIVDRVKASPDMLGRFKSLTKETYIAATAANDVTGLKGNTYFWWSLGADQMAHHLTHYIIIWSLL
jgi:hypothetical protein